MIDLTVGAEQGCTSEITIGDNTYNSCKLKWTTSLGRWTMIYATSLGAPIPVITGAVRTSLSESRRVRFSKRSIHLG